MKRMEIVLSLVLFGTAVLAAAMAGDLMAGVAVVALMIVLDLAIFGGHGLAQLSPYIVGGKENGRARRIALGREVRRY